MTGVENICQIRIYKFITFYSYDLTSYDSGIQEFRNWRNSISFNLLILSFNPSIPKSLNMAQIDIGRVQKSWLILKVSYYIWIKGLWRLNLEGPFAVQGIVEADDFTFFFHSEAAG